MPHKDPEARRRYRSQYHKRWYEQHRDEVLARMKGYRPKYRDARVRQRELIHELKDVPCADCGYSFHPECMDFDHRTGVDKVANVSEMLTRYNEKQILDEIAKCDVVCACCHRLRSKMQRQASAKWNARRKPPIHAAGPYIQEVLEI